jgi:hypothetical protein
LKSGKIKFNVICFVGDVLALKDLFQQLMNEMVHLNGILFRYNITSDEQKIDSLEKPTNTGGKYEINGTISLR